MQQPNAPLLIDIVCAIDNAYAPHCAAMLSSLFATNSARFFNIYIITDGLELSVAQKFEQFILSSGHTYSIIKINRDELGNAPVNHHISLATYFHLLIPKVLPASISKVLFLDSDIIVRQSIDALWNISVENFNHAATIAAGMDTYGQELGLPSDALYFNAGMMLNNLERWRQLEVFEQGCTLIQQQAERLKWWDQDILNLLLSDSWLPVDLTWNAQPFVYEETLNARYEFQERYQKYHYLQARQDPAIVHFVGGGSAKPWHYYCNHPFKDDYRRCLEMTPWKHMPLSGQPDLLAKLRYHLGMGSKIRGLLRLSSL